MSADPRVNEKATSVSTKCPKARLLGEYGDKIQEESEIRNESQTSLYMSCPTVSPRQLTYMGYYPPPVQKHPDGVGEHTYGQFAIMPAGNSGIAFFDRDPSSYS
jgi:hypothetical protein